MYPFRKRKFSEYEVPVIPSSMQDLLVDPLEEHASDTEPPFSYFSIGVNNNFQLLNGLYQGPASYQRTGTKIAMRRLSINYCILPSLLNGAPVEAFPGRILIVYDKQANTTQPLVADILQSQLSGGGATSNNLSHFNFENLKRFDILYDKYVYLPGLGVNGATPAKQQGVDPDPLASNSSMVGHISIDMKDRVTQYNKNSTGSISDIMSGSLYLITLSLLDTNPTSAWFFWCSARLTYVD